MDYKATVFLPRTDFPDEGRPAEARARDPGALGARSTSTSALRDAVARAGRSSSSTTARPTPTATSTSAHALNKILKDVVNRGQQMLGKDANYVPGWDCHGLPIEWKIEEEYRAKGKDKDEVPIVEFRRECREFAEHWIDVQRGEFKRLGVIGDWDNPYTTMDFAAEAQIVRELGKFLLNGALYRGSKPVMWSVVEKTALAEAEVEYHDHTSTTICVRFPVARAPASRCSPARRW